MLKKYLTVLCISLCIVLAGHASFAEEIMTLEQIMEKVEKAGENVSDIEFKHISFFKFEGNDGSEDMAHVYHKVPDQTMISSDKYVVVIAKENGELYAITHMLDENKFYKIKTNQEVIKESTMFGYSRVLREEIKNKKNREFRVERVGRNGKPFWLVRSENKGPVKYEYTNYYVDPEYWLITQTESKTERVLIKNRLEDIKINQGMEDDIFLLKIPNDVDVERGGLFDSDIKSIEIANFGYVTPLSLEKAAGNLNLNCEGLSMSMCEDQLIKDAYIPGDEVPGQIGVGFGLTFRVNAESDSSVTPIMGRFIYPRMIDPATGEEYISEDQHLFKNSDGLYALKWIFQNEWEVVPGEWKLQVVYAPQDEVLLEKAFQVIPTKDIYEFRPELKKQIEAAKTIIQRNPNDANAVKNLGNIYLDAKDYRQAIAYYQKAIQIQNHPNFYNNLCLAHRELKEYDKAFEACNEALRLFPGHTSALINRGITYKDVGKYQEAIVDFDASLKAAPQGDTYNPPMAYFNRAQTYGSIGNWDQAITDCQRAMEIKPDYANCTQLIKYWELKIHP